LSHPDLVSLWPEPEALGTVTDLYQLTMMAGYHSEGLDRSRATFELFVRRLPQNRSYLVFAGLEQAILDLMRLKFSREQVEVLRHWPVFAGVDPTWFDELPGYRFRGDVWSVPEGTIVFAGEPIFRVEASLPEAQWVETFLIASLAYPTLVASKAARMVGVAGGRPLIDFGTRRGHGPMSGILTARASYLAGFAGTSNVEAAIRLGIPAAGTMAHSWVQSFADEALAFSAFARLYPGSTVLVDTYDVERAVRLAASVEPRIGGVRIDSGDLLALSREARRILVESGREDVKIVGSGDLDEARIGELIRGGAEIDSFGVGTELVTSTDAPALSMVYKLVELDGVGRIKLSPGKKTYPSAKQVFRRRDGDGRILSDHVTRADESAEGETLLVQILQGGRLITALPTLLEARRHCAESLACLPDSLRGLDSTASYPLTYSDALEAEADRTGVRQVGHAADRS
jgi:nicotinate phosphoribosyltransferase